MTLTKQLAIKLHRKLWRWIADETERRKEIVKKSDYPLFERKIIRWNCWCCEYAKEECKNCPIEWAKKEHNDHLGLEMIRCTDGEYRKWYKATERGDWKEAAHWARVIAELPERGK